MARPQKQKENPIFAAIRSWLDSLPPSLVENPAGQQTSQAGPDDARQQLLDRAPKRWVVYEPMVLLPSGSFTAAPWPALLGRLSPAQAASLWTAILDRLSPSPSSSKQPLTHLAINEGIPLHLSPPSPGSLSTGEAAAADTAGGEPAAENVLRSPTGLRALHGSFGAPCHKPRRPSESDFASALWVRARQNGIEQTWAPRHTMFSRGNVKEKARLLAPSSPWSSQPASSSSRHGHRSAANGGSTSTSTSTSTSSSARYAVDLYAGIGYFAFSYARLGLRVLCWELNAWSVEGLRRGAALNGWTVRVVVPPSPSPSSGSGSNADAAAAKETAEILRGGGGEQIVVFLEDNARAAARLRGLGLDVAHVNCGFLPTSRAVWRDAWDMVVGTGAGGWLHLHENVGEEEVETRRAEVQRLFDQWAAAEAGKEARVEHVELVKTFAPGVWHCVFDVFITRSSDGGVGAT